MVKRTVLKIVRSVMNRRQGSNPWASAKYWREQPVRNRDCLLSRSCTSVHWSRNPASPQIFALVVQWIEHLTTDQEMRVRILPGVQWFKMKSTYKLWVYDEILR